MRRLRNIYRLSIFLLKIALKFNKWLKKEWNRLDSKNRRLDSASVCAHVVICNNDEAALSKSLGNYMVILENFQHITCVVFARDALMAITAFYARKKEHDRNIYKNK